MVSVELNDCSLLLLPLPERIREYRRRERALVEAFAQAVRTADAHRFGPALVALQYSATWPLVVRAVENFDPPDKFRRHCLWSWLQFGDSLRNELADDLLLIKLLRVLLPKYTGPTLTLYRGETFRNRFRRTYGMSWTTNIDVARRFANGTHCTCDGGSVVLKTRVKRAIVCAPKMIDNRFKEDEVLVDRRQLAQICVIERVPQMPLDEYFKRPKPQRER